MSLFSNSRLPLHPLLMTRMLFFVVFLSGAAVMVIELLGTRLVAPFYGASLYVWTSLIAVTMMALAAGYFLGGRLADRGLSLAVSGFLWLAGFLCGWLPFLAPWVLELTNQCGLRAGAFLSALLLFFPVLMILGMVGPFAIRRLTDRLVFVGVSAGKVYATSALGSFLGTLVLGFFLFPMVGSREIFIGLGLLLSLTGFLAFVVEWRESGKKMGFQSMAFGLGLFFVTSVPLVRPPLEPQSPSIEIVSEEESLYGWVRVMDFKDKDIRILTSDASVIGAETRSTGESRLNYQVIADVMPSLRPGMKRALLIGQGAGHIAMVLERLYGIRTDTIEIDPAVATAATRFFGFKPSGEARVGDARYEIAHMQGPYDLIIHDCFTGGSEPTHLLTQETFERLNQLLSPDGIMALNTVGFFDEGKNPAIASVAKTVDAVFPFRRVFVAVPGEDFNDFVVIGTRNPLKLNPRGLPDGVQGFLEAREVRIDASSGVILSDDFNPFEHLQLRKSEKYRQLVTEWIGLKLMIR